MKTLLRKILDRLYLISGMIGAFFLCAILVLIVLQMAARWSGISFPGSTSYAGYCMGAASFFSLAYALNHGAHIRVTILINQLGRYQKLAHIWCLAIASIIAAYFCYYSIKTTYWSHKLGEVSQDRDITPIWIPQISMSIGTTIFTLALVDILIHTIRSQNNQFHPAIGGGDDLTNDNRDQA